MNRRTVRDLIGDPQLWTDHLSDPEEGAPNMDTAKILGVFTDGNQLSVHTRNAHGAEALSVFSIDDPLTRTCVALALTPGMAVHDAISNAIE